MQLSQLSLYTVLRFAVQSCLRTGEMLSFGGKQSCNIVSRGVYSMSQLKTNIRLVESDQGHSEVKS